MLSLVKKKIDTVNSLVSDNLWCTEVISINIIHIVITLKAKTQANRQLAKTVYIE